MRKIDIGFSFLILSSLLLAGPASAQKIKYKDLIVLLSSKQYEKAEPFLKRYIKENDDNPNAFLYMGIVYQEKSLKIDPLVHTEILLASMDSSLLFFDKAYKTITERELRKNDEYYEPYMRRDLRTGKFVIKLSDVQLDVENRIHTLKTRKEKVAQLKEYFVASSRAYQRTTGLYKSLEAKYGAEREFFLRSDNEMLKALTLIAQTFDSAMAAFDNYKTVSKELGKTGYNQVIDLQEIKDMKRDGSTLADFMKDDLRVWDYKRWAMQASDVIEKEINPMRDNLVAYDIEVNKLREKLKTDSVSVKNDLTRLVDKLLAGRLRKYDPDPMPLALFSMKVAELEYHSDVIAHKPLRDSLNVRMKLSALKSEISDLKKLDSLSGNLGKRDFAEEEKDYHHFIANAFGTTAVLQSLISTTQDFAKREKSKKETEWEKTSQSLKWLIVKGDSVPLFVETNRELKFKPIVIEEEKFTLGLSYQDSLATGYLYNITPSRVPTLKVNFQVDQPNFKKRKFPLLKGLITNDGTFSSIIVLIYSTEKVGGKFPATLAKIYRTEGLAWNINIGFELIPSELKLSNENGEISVKLMDSDGTAKLVLFDKSGKQAK